MASIPKPKSKVYLNGEYVAGVRSADIRIAAHEVQQATLVLFCDDIQITEDGSIYLQTEKEKANG